MKLKNIVLALKDQLPLKRLIRNLWNGRVTGLTHPRTHLNANGTPKIMYNTKATAVRSAEAMSKKVGVPFGNWKCMHCDGFHIGKNRSYDNWQQVKND
jgi:hypothetical protein